MNSLICYLKDNAEGIIQSTYHDKVNLCLGDELVRRRLVRHEEVPSGTPSEGYRAAEVEDCL